MKRRSVLRALALAPVAILGGCAGSGASFDPATIADDVANLSAGLSALAAMPMVRAALTPADATTVAAALADAHSIAAQLAQVTGSLQMPTAQDWVSAVAADIGAVLAIVAVIPGLPPQASTIMAALRTLLPVVETAVALDGADALHGSGASTAAPAMKPDQARRILRARR